MVTERGMTLRRIAAVAAILTFAASVFAPMLRSGARAQRTERTTCAANIRQLAGAFLLYAEDHDDRFPLAMTVDGETGRWRTGEDFKVDDYGPFPWNWRVTQGRARRSENLTHWANAVTAYVPTYDIYRCPVSPARSLVESGIPAKEYSDYDRSAAPLPVTYTFNGLLHTYESSAVEASEKLPLLWEGNGKVSFLGFARHNPYLKCTTIDEPCVYRPGGPPCGGHFASKKDRLSPAASYFIHGQGMHFAYVDGHAAHVTLGVPVPRAGAGTWTDYRVDPFPEYEEGGYPTMAFFDGCHAWFFRPAYEFDR
ncbi:MAG: type II secretion system protein [Armatimonadetes bacterium]|nr:type II secretion system protein [Armatimonadota bacterium]